jgi:8-oxo-dGTP pyrophosphatase MutT (NUDIX family)
VSRDSLTPICFDCARLRGVAPDVGWACDAFPAGIPVQILASSRDHREPYPGDGGLTFVPKRLTITEDDRLALDPPVSEAQRRAMWAEAGGHGTSGIPKSVAQEFTEADPGGKLPERVGKDLAPGKWKILKRLFGEWLDEEEAEPEHREGEGGRDSSWDRKGRAASVAFTTRDGKVLLLRRAKDEENWPDAWSFPGGQADGEEDFEACARREAREECGDVALDGIRELERIRTPNDYEHATYVVPVKDEFEPNLSKEHSDFAWVPVTELPERTHPGVRAAIDKVIGARPMRRSALDGWELMGTDEWGPEARAAAAKSRGQGGSTPHLHMTATHEKGAAHGRFATAASNHGEVEKHLGAVHQHAKSTGGNYNVSIENKHTGEVHGAKVAPHGVYKRSYTAGSFDESEEAKKRAEGKLSERTREEIGTVGSEHREDMPDSDFLLPSEKKYPVKKDGKYDRGLLLAAAREARMHGHEDLAKRADEIRAREFGSTEDSALAMDWRGAAILSHSLPCELGFYDPNGPVPPVFDFAYDRESARRYDEDGHLHVKDVKVAKASVNEYLGKEIPGYEKLGLDPKRKYRLYRDPDELERAVGSIKGKPILNDHAPINADTHDPKMVVGSVGTDARWDEPFIRSTLSFWPSKASREIESDTRRALSPAYRYKPDMMPGKTPDGEPYDGVMRDISFSHLAQIPEGRQGPDVVVSDAALDDEEEESIMGVQLSPKAALGLGQFLGHFAPKMKQNGMAIEQSFDAGEDAWSPEARAAAAAARKTKSSGAESERQHELSTLRRLHAKHGTPMSGGPPPDLSTEHGREIAELHRLHAKHGTPVPHAAGAKDAASISSVLSPIWAGITSRNFDSQRPALDAALRAALKGKLANDADIGEVTQLLEAISGVEAGADTTTEANSGLPPYMREETEDEDDETEEEKREDEEYDKRARDARHRLGRDETEEEREEREEEEEEEAEDREVAEEEDPPHGREPHSFDRAKRASDARKRLGRDETEEEREEREKREEGEDRRKADDRARDRRRLGRDYRHARDAHRHARDAHRKAANDWRHAKDAHSAAMDGRKADDAARHARDMAKADEDCRDARDRMVRARDARHRARDARRSWDKRHGRDARRTRDDSMTRAAMDAAINERVRKEVADAVAASDRRHQEITEALEHVRSRGAGRIAMDGSVRTAADVYDRALTVLRIDHDGIRDARALRRLFEVAQRPGAGEQRSGGFALDAHPVDATAEFAEWFPGAARIERT